MHCGAAGEAAPAVVPVLAVLLPVQLPAKAPEGGPSICVPATHVGDPDGVPGPAFDLTKPLLLWPRGYLGREPVGRRYLFLSLSFSLIAFQ